MDSQPPAPRVRILDAARRLFADVGFHRATVRHIADQAGVNPAMIHYYFRSKRALYRGVIEAELESILRTVIGRAEAGLPPEETLISLFLGLTDELHGDHTRAGLLRHDLAGGGDALASTLHKLWSHEAAGFGRLALQLIREGQAQGRIRRLPESAIMALLQAIALGSLLAQAPPDQSLDSGSTDADDWAQYLETCEIVLRKGLLADFSSGAIDLS